MLLFYKIVNLVENIIRAILCKRNLWLVNHKEGAKIGANTIIGYGKNIYLGKNTYINGGFIKASENAVIKIGDNCLISYNVHIRTDTHNFECADKLIKEQGHRDKSIYIEDDVWIGYGAQILPGISIGRGGVIGAGAVVTKDVAPYTVVAGVPAKEIGKRQ